MKFIIEANIPYIKGILEPFAEVIYLSPEDITPMTVKDCTAMVLRTRTRCNEKLLAQSSCQWIGTATIGTDHIDKIYCKNRGITTVSAPGCNAPAVAQYVLSTIGNFMQQRGLKSPSELTLGIVGVGHVGSIISAWAKNIGFKVLECDPPRACLECGDNFVSLDAIAQKADIITFHTPLTVGGDNATFHLCNADFINSLNGGMLLINAARGGVVDSQALLNALRTNVVSAAAIDCWENEPHIDLELLSQCFVATPHIAGYSSQGKMRATLMMLAALAEHFNLPLTKANGFDLSNIDMGIDRTPSLTELMAAYNPLEDTALLRQNPDKFEPLRNNYNYRSE